MPTELRDRREGRGVGRRRPSPARALAAAVLSIATAVAHASAQRMIEPERVVLSIRGAGSASDPAAMHRVIVGAAALHGWEVTADQPGRLTLHVFTGTHGATVDVVYDGDGFQIKYRASADMDYEVEDGRTVIHPRYNKWVSELSNEIRRGARDAVPQRRHRAGIDPDAAAPGASAVSSAAR